jgi:phosphoribosylformylglycinamidine synthase
MRTAKIKSRCGGRERPMTRAGPALLEGREIKMLAKVYVTLKNGVLDPQGKAIHHAAETIGYRGIADVRQGKYFEIKLDESIDEASARAEIEKFAHDVLSNPVIEDYRVEIVAN